MRHISIVLALIFYFALAAPATAGAHPPGAHPPGDPVSEISERAPQLGPYADPNG